MSKDFGYCIFFDIVFGDLLLMVKIISDIIKCLFKWLCNEKCVVGISLWFLNVYI